MNYLIFKDLLSKPTHECVALLPCRRTDAIQEVHELDLKAIPVSGTTCPANEFEQDDRMLPLRSDTSCCALYLNGLVL